MAAGIPGMVVQVVDWFSYRRSVPWKEMCKSHVWAHCTQKNIMYSVHKMGFISDFIVVFMHLCLSNGSCRGLEMLKFNEFDYDSQNYIRHGILVKHLEDVTLHMEFADQGS